MTVSGSLKDFSLPELFQILDQRQKTGLLTIRSSASSVKSGISSQNFYFWLHRGRIVAAADRIDGTGLLSMIGEQGWLSARVASRLAQVCVVDKPIGRSLKNQGLLQTKQLKFLFCLQILQHVCPLFELSKGEFSFNPTAPLPTTEMTGLRIPATEATLIALRALRGSKHLAHRLPHPDSALASTTTVQPHFRLDDKEWQVWEFANGTASLATIAAQLQMSVLKVQQIAFALVVVGLAQEVPVSESTSPNQLTALFQESEITTNNKPNLNSFLIQSFIGFLLPKT
jgi:hypothetical protein